MLRRITAKPWGVLTLRPPKRPRGSVKRRLIHEPWAQPTDPEVHPRSPEWGETTA